MLGTEQEIARALWEIEASTRLNHVLSTLSYRERAMISLRYGLIDGHAYTFREIGAAFHITRERVRMIVSKAIRKLQHPARAKWLRQVMMDVCEIEALPNSNEPREELLDSLESRETRMDIQQIRSRERHWHYLQTRRKAWRLPVTGAGRRRKHGQQNFEGGSRGA